MAPIPPAPKAALLGEAGLVVRFVISGGLAAASLFATLYVLTDVLGLWYVASAALAWLVSMLVSFALQRAWTFRTQGRARATRQLTQFMTLGVMNAAINAGLMYALVDRLGVHYLLAQFGLAFLIAAWNFVIMRYAIFTPRAGD